MNNQEFDHLLQSLLDGEPQEFDPVTLTLEQRSEFIQFLTAEPELRDALSRPGSFVAGVMKAFSTDNPTERQEFREAVMLRKGKALDTRKMRPASIVPLGIAAALMIMWAVSSFWHPVKHDLITDPDQAERFDPKAPVGIVVAEAAAVFDMHHRPDGISCHPGSYQLESGAIHLRLLNGVDLAIKGPARFVIHDSFNLDFEQGFCRARVPESGQGFTMNTSEMKVIDLGTEFGVYVDPNSKVSEVRVFDGEVDVLKPNSNDKTRLTRDEALRISSTEGITAPRIDMEDFPDIRSIGFSQWQQWRNKISKDPDLIAYLPMQGDQESAVQVISSLPDPPVAELSGAGRVVGRWPGKGALLFERDGDRVELDLGMNHDELTIAMWVKAERWDYHFAALANSNGWGPGAIHLQTSRETGRKIHGSIRLGDEEKSVRAYSSATMEIGRWHHVAYVLSKRTGQFQVFVNGVAGYMNEGEKNFVPKIPANTPINPGVIRLGDWKWDSTLKRDHVGVHPKQKGFRGRIDEFVALSRALSQKEIDEMVGHGRPSFLWPE